VLHISSDAAFIAVTAGMFLIYAELCAPGRVIPGSLGALGVLGGGWLLAQKHLTAPGLAALAAGLLFLAAAIRLRSWRIWAGLSVVCLSAGSYLLVGGSDALSPPLSLPLSAIWAVVTIGLGRLAWKTHIQKKSP
jgi:membrane-bound ClpP family serine protease